ncbi:MAG TPA: class I SAM-dependent methyltransferase [Nannocystaceae bacterium]|nr:class I SAM-dependent methyltransferase [Nannocystaceae bacterium]
MTPPGAQEPSGGGRRRGALAQPGGPMRTSGDRELAEQLADAMLGARGDADRWTHGFHVYPARMHPEIAARLCRRFVAKDKVVLDPFCGSGTVLVEASAAGARSIGVDLNPLALRLAALKCTRTDDDLRARLLATCREVVERTLAGVRARADVRAPLSATVRRSWDGHVLRELAVLHREIGLVEAPFVREALLLVFSAIVVKFSRQRADTSADEVQRNIGKGVPTRFFARKTEELVRRLAELAAALPADATAPRLVLGDARELAVGDASVDVVITSPPYVGTYDYVLHHALRWPWLGIDPSPLVKGEIGARRDATTQGGAVRWERDLSRVLAGVARTLKPDGLVLWVAGDGEIGGRRIPADDQLRTLAPKHGLELVAIASQRRVDWHGGAAREEHLAALRANAPINQRGLARLRSPHPARPGRR